MSADGMLTSRQLDLDALAGSGWTYYTTDDAAALATSLAQGSYQRALVAGDAAWSGGDLQGKARKFGARYAASRDALIARLRPAGLSTLYVRDLRGGSRRHVLVVGPPAIVDPARETLIALAQVGVEWSLVGDEIHVGDRTLAALGPLVAFARGKRGDGAPQWIAAAPSLDALLRQ